MTIAIDRTGAEVLGSLIIDDTYVRGYAARFPDARQLYIEAKARVTAQTQTPPPIKRRRTSKVVNAPVGAIA